MDLQVVVHLLSRLYVYLAHNRSWLRAQRYLLRGVKGKVFDRVHRIRGDTSGDELIRVSLKIADHLLSTLASLPVWAVSLPLTRLQSWPRLTM